MDNVVDSLNNAYQDFVSAAANVLEVKENAGFVKTTATDTALENFKQKVTVAAVARHGRARAESPWVFVEALFRRQRWAAIGSR
ncbi:hypothetical protein VIGAN_11046600 [Vigna angularis var. angularis]|uniref:Uncharacterized protein n=1 Tax=Vigna angularis var. angularis TaxID=157739 RepID=A0A0S3T8J7_PHAAN|nr:hypothetical protein VIGAN_11046600 [Vigna angularis var. angularis]